MSSEPAPLGDETPERDRSSETRPPNFPVPLRPSPPPAGFRFKGGLRSIAPQPPSDESTASTEPNEPINWRQLRTSSDPADSLRLRPRGQVSELFLAQHWILEE